MGLWAIPSPFLLFFYPSDTVHWEGKSVLSEGRIEGERGISLLSHSHFRSFIQIEQFTHSTTSSSNFPISLVHWILFSDDETNVRRTDILSWFSYTLLVVLHVLPEWLYFSLDDLLSQLTSSSPWSFLWWPTDLLVLAWDRAGWTKWNSVSDPRT